MRSTSAGRSFRRDCTAANSLPALQYAHRLPRGGALRFGYRVLSRIPATIFTAYDGAPPGLILDIPLHGGRQAQAQRPGRSETQPGDLTAIDSVAAIVSRPVADVLNEATGRAALRGRAARIARLEPRTPSELF